MPSRNLSMFEEDVPEAPGADFHPSPQQRPIGDWFADGDGNATVDAKAGTGKTTTILWAIDRAPEQAILLTAFNKRIQQTLQDRLTNPNAKAQTLHSIGYQAIREELPRAFHRTCEPSYDRERYIAGLVTEGAPWGAKRLVGSLFTKARELRPLTTSVPELLDLMADFDLLPPPGDRLMPYEVAQMALQALELATREDVVEHTGIDYADMLFLPLRLELLKPRFDMGVVDEAQDMSDPQMAMVRAVVHSYGRIVIVGDERQAIYGWRGADVRMLSRLTRELHATVFPLTHTFRCPKAVVALAQRVVPEFTVDESAAEGTVDSVPELLDVVRQSKAGDFVLSRKNAPLARVAMAILRTEKTKRVRILGRDIGRGLTTQAKSLATGAAAKSIPAFLERLTNWADKQTTRLLKMKRPDKIDAVRDTAETLRVLALDAESVPALLSRIDYLFTDSDTDGVVCSTVHKAKGLEADRVFVLKDTFFIPAPCECGHRHPSRPCGHCACVSNSPDADKQLEEQNLWYVAVTRAKQHLTICEERL